jgi:hypothetical protein
MPLMDAAASHYIKAAQAPKNKLPDAKALKQRKPISNSGAIKC